jgi:hypothetical protein
MLLLRTYLATTLALLAGGVAGAPPAAAAGVPGTAMSGVANGIPDTAMLGAADLGGIDPIEADDDSWTELRPPRPCGLTPPDPIDDRAITAVVGENNPSAVMEYVAVHTAGGAERYLLKLRKALKNCPDWRLERAAADRLTLRRTRHWEHVGEQITHHTFVTVARTGPVVVLVSDSGWETSSGDPAITGRLITPALRRAAPLH